MNQNPLWSLSSFLATQINHRKPFLETLKGSFQMFFSQINHISKQLMAVPVTYLSTNCAMFSTAIMVNTLDAANYVRNRNIN
jgi:hypothetical protein